MAALLSEIALQLDLPADRAVFWIRVDELVSHAIVVGVLVVQNARALERLHVRDVALTDVHESGLRIGCGRGARAQALTGVELLALGPPAALRLCFIIHIHPIALCGSAGVGSVPATHVCA